MKVFTASELSALLGAAGTSIEELVEKANAVASSDVESAERDIEHDQMVVRSAQARIAVSSKSLQESRKILRIAAKFA